MELITKRELIKTTIDRWAATYLQHLRINPSLAGNKYEIYLKLKNEQPQTEDAIEAIIGNRSWTRLICNECKQDVEVCVQLGEEPNYESSTARICIACLTKALALIAEAKS